jgi:hypothetical protein
MLSIAWGDCIKDILGFVTRIYLAVAVVQVLVLVALWLFSDHFGLG